MACRVSNADFIQFALGPLSGYTVGPVTLATFVKRSNVTVNETPILVLTSSFGNRTRLMLDPLAFTAGTNGQSTLGMESTSVWFLVVVTWAGGSAVPRFHVHDGTSWTHADRTSGGNSDVTVASDDMLYVGGTVAGTATYDVACSGIKKADRSDGQVEALTRTAFQSWRDFGFDWLIGFDSSLVSGGNLQDQASPGTGDQIAVVGSPTPTGITDPPGWAWTGAGATTYTKAGGAAAAGVAAGAKVRIAAIVKAGRATVAGVAAGAKVRIAAPVTSTKAGHGVVGLSAFAVVIAPFEHPQGFFSIAFDAPPMTANPHWTKIDTLSGCRVRDWTIDRGRPNEFAKTDVGTAVVRLVDRAGLFDPTNTTSPYHGKVLPGKQAAIALQNPVTDVWWTLFRGYIEAWHYRLDPTEQYMELELQLVDGFAILSRAELRVGIDGALPLPEEIAAGNIGYGETIGSVSDRIQAILGDVGWPLALREPGVDVFSGNVRVGPKAYGPGTSALDCLWDAADAEFPGVGNMFMGGPTAPGHFIFRGRQARFRPDVAQYKIQRRTVGDPSAFTLDEDVVPVAELEWSNGHDNLFNACSATPQGIGSGSSWRPINPDEPDNDDVAGQYVINPTSIAAHGRRSLTFDNLQTIRGTAGAGTDALEETKKFATYYAENYATPTPRISRMVFKTRRPEDPNGEALWNHLCKCEISDLLTLQTEHPGGGGFDDQFYVEGIHYTGRPGPPEYPIVELALDVSPRAHYTTNPFDEDDDT